MLPSETKFYYFSNHKAANANISSLISYPIKKKKADVISEKRAIIV